MFRLTTMECVALASWVAGLTGPTTAVEHLDMWPESGYAVVELHTHHVADAARIAEALGLREVLVGPWRQGDGGAPDDDTWARPTLWETRPTALLTVPGVPAPVAVELLGYEYTLDPYAMGGGA